MHIFLSLSLGWKESLPPGKGTTSCSQSCSNGVKLEYAKSGTVSASNKGAVGLKLAQHLGLNVGLAFYRAHDQSPPQLLADCTFVPAS
jgi:hypothetical protein